MTPTTYQKPEIRDANDNIIQQGAFGKNTALANATNDGWIDYVANDLEFLYDLAKDEVVPVPSLPASGQLNKTYLLTTTGVSYRWSGTEWVAVSSSEAVGRAESAALLAEQWATKTDGTVDGSEYSAKYYAQQAEASADDAQDVADDMADHLVQIDKNTGGVSKNSKRISNIEKLLQGNLYDYDTDDDVAYVKDVPSGALPYAGVEKLGGKTVVWNQLVNADGWNSTMAGVTVTAQNGVVTMTGTATASRVHNLQTINIVSEHKYLLYTHGVSYPISSVPNSFVQVYGENVINIQIPENSQNSYVFGSATGSGQAYIRLRQQIDETYNYTLTPQFFDLTLMFGAGNEPSTVQEFQQMFPADWYPYNAGTLLSAGVTEVKSVGKNLCDGTAVLGTISSGQAYVVNNTAITSPYTVPTNYHGVLFHANVEAGKTYTISSDITVGVNTLWYWAVYNSMAEATSRSNMLEYGNTANSFTPTHSGVCIFMHYYTANTSVSWTKVQLEVGSTATAYSPYMDITMPIPAEVQALEGYGWSAGTAYNYVDLERKVFVKRVARVNLGNVTWSVSSWGGTPSPFYTNTIQSVIKKPADGVKGNLLTSRFVVMSRNDLNSATTEGICANSGGSVNVRCNGYATAEELRVGLDGVYLYYELATPIETDISAYLTDNLIEVGAGGTLTFPNSNGADYHIPVPSTETYMIDLQEAISNG